MNRQQVVETTEFTITAGTLDATNLNFKNLRQENELEKMKSKIKELEFKIVDLEADTSILYAQLD